jgi:hypothetical protein
MSAEIIGALMDAVIPVMTGVFAIVLGRKDREDFAFEEGGYFDMIHPYLAWVGSGLIVFSLCRVGFVLLG